MIMNEAMDWIRLDLNWNLNWNWIKMIDNKLYRETNFQQQEEERKKIFSLSHYYHHRLIVIIYLKNKTKTKSLYSFSLFLIKKFCFSLSLSLFLPSFHLIVCAMLCCVLCVWKMRTRDRTIQKLLIEWAI